MLQPSANITFSRKTQDHSNEQASQPDQFHAPVLGNLTLPSAYEQRCAIDMENSTELHDTSFRGKLYHVVTLTIPTAEGLNFFHEPAITYRRKYSDDIAKKFEEHVAETGPSDKFGTISVMRDRHGRGIVVDGRRRLEVYKTLVRDGILGIGDVSPKTPSDFKWYRDVLTVRLFIPASFTPPTDSDILSLCIALNGDKSDSTTLSDADVYVMLQNFMLHLYGPERRSVSFFHNKVSDIITKAISAKLLDHLFDRQPRDKVHKIGGASSSADTRSKTRMSSEEAGLRQLYSRYIRAAICFLNKHHAFNLVFNKFGFNSPLWCKELLCYEKFMEMDQTEMTVSLALMAKRYVEKRRKGDLDMTPAEERKVIDLVSDMLRVVKSVAKDMEALNNAYWKHFLGARLKGHKDKHVAANPYIHSLAFFVLKWNERTIWKKELILKEVERDRLLWPPHRRWRGHTFELKDFNESFFRKEIITRKHFQNKRKRISTSGTRTSKRQRVVNKRNLGEESSEYYETEDDQGPTIIENQAQQSGQGNEHLNGSNTASATNLQTQTVAVPSAAGPSSATGPAPPSMPINRDKATEESNDSAQLSQFMNFILKKAGVENTLSIDVGDLLQAESSQFIEKIIENLQKLGPSAPQRASRDDLNDVDENMDDVDGTIDDDEDKKLLEKAKRIWDVLEKRFENDSLTTACFPEPCQGVGLWGKLITPVDAVNIKQDVRNAILHSRQVPSGSDEVVNERIIDMFKDMRGMELKYQGFTVCEGFLKSKETKDWVVSFLRYYMRYFTRKDTTGKERNDELCPWESIVNVGTGHDEEPLKKGIGRYQVSSISDVLYLTKHKLPLYRKKLKLEIFVGNLICSIVRAGNSPLRFPSFGSKLLIHTPGAKAQKIHCDYPVKKGSVLEENEVKYFAIVTGEKPSYLHVLPMGHMEITKRSGSASNIESKLVEIPPFSLGLFRGDLPHGGSGAEDDIAQRGQFEFAPRIHFYIDRPEDKDKIVMEPSFLFYPS